MKEILKTIIKDFHEAGIPEFIDREIKGLQEAMNWFNLEQGIIITKEQEEEYKNIKIIPAWKWLLREKRVS